MTRRQWMKMLGQGAAAGMALPLAAQLPPPGQQQRAAAPGSRHPAQMGGMATPRRPGRKNVLAWGDVRNGFQHDSVSHAFSVIEELGYVSQLYDTYIRTDSQLITKHGLYGSDGQVVYGHDLNDFDAIFFFGVREIDLTAEQRADLLAFVHDDGKGFVAVHTATTAFMSWPEFGDLLGARFVNHPWNTVEAPVVVEDRSFPATRFLPPVFNFRDEMYQNKGINRDEVDVLLRLDVSHLDTRQANIELHNGDFPLAWSKSYGKGKVFYCALGHHRTVWDIPDVQRIYFEALRWALGLTPGEIRPHPMRPAAAAPVPLAPPLAPCGPAWALASRRR
ncbi:MAG TPA: ThuA domain-containing protein [Terriglobales bacterium]|nr:ThuA domain-containing protein [Terriglobales bacterium]